LKRTLEKLLSGLSDKSIKFNDLVGLMRALGFIERVKGDHHIFTMDGILEIINLQPLKDGTSKAYQVKQVRNIVLKYKLHQEVRDV